MKKVIAINAGPRMNWNTDLLIKEAMKGLEDNEVEVEYISLYKLERFTGCISCFLCKREVSLGKCACKDALSEVLEKIRNADGLIIGSPNYLGNLTAEFRALYERLIFQYLTYNKEVPCINDRKIPVLLITTSNVADAMYDAVGYTALLENYKNTFTNFIGPTEVLVCGDTLQVNDYSMYNWTIFNPEDKKKHHDETFHTYLEKAYMLGKNLLN